MQNRCKWDNALSESFLIPSGVKQGGVISPRIFIVYVDDLIKRLRKSGLGCHIVFTFVAAILFADKLCLMAPTRKSMQMLLTICEEYCSEYCLTINAKKVKLWFLVTYMVVMYFR